MILTEKDLQLLSSLQSSPNHNQNSVIDSPTSDIHHHHHNSNIVGIGNSSVGSAGADRVGTGKDLNDLKIGESQICCYISQKYISNTHTHTHNLYILILLNLLLCCIILR